MLSLLTALVASSTVATADPIPVDLEPILTRHTKLRYPADLDEVKKRGVLRVLTRNNSSSYFVGRGRELGFQYEMTKAFAQELGVRLAMVVPTKRAGLMPALLRGEGDLIAAGMTPTKARSKLVRFTSPLFDAQRVFVTHQHTVKVIEQMQDIFQFEVHVDFRSTTHTMATELARKLGLQLRIVDVPGSVEMEEMLRRIGDGRYEATIVDRNILQLEQFRGVPVVERIPIGEPLGKVWAVRPSATQLHAAAEDFIARRKKNGFLRIKFLRYFAARHRTVRRAHDDYRADAEGAISRFDDAFRKAGERTGIDWRLLAAVAHSESRFDPSAQSRFGAVGLMQILPSTASRAAGLRGDRATVETLLRNPTVNIYAGARYLKRLVDTFDAPELEPRQRIRFALAAYNAGLGHVFDAMQLAEETGKDPNRWFGNVEQAMLLKKNPKWHHKTRHGYANGEQTVAYVSRVQTQYDVYSRHVKFDEEDEETQQEEVTDSPPR